MTAHSNKPVAISVTQTTEAIDQDKRKLLATAAAGVAALGAASLFHIRPAHAAANDEIRPFRVNIPDADLVDLRRRLEVT